MEREGEALEDIIAYTPMDTFPGLYPRFQFGQIDLYY